MTDDVERRTGYSPAEIRDLVLGDEDFRAWRHKVASDAASASTGVEMLRNEVSPLLRQHQVLWDERNVRIGERQVIRFATGGSLVAIGGLILELIFKR